MPTYLVTHVPAVPDTGKPVTARAVIVDATDQTAGFKAAADALGGVEEGVFALTALTNVTAKRVKRNPPTFTVEDL